MHPDGEPSRPVVSAQALAGLRQLQAPGRPDFLAQVVGVFRNETPAHLAALRQAAEQGDHLTLRLTAHALKGNAATFGAHELDSSCVQLEQLAGSGTTEGAGRLIDELTLAFHRVEAALVQAIAPRDDVH
jgi:hypothetical protein